MNKKISSILMAATMAATTVTPALASEIEVTEAGGTGNSKVTFEVVDTGSPEDPTIFSAYVPAILPIKMNLDGEITTPTNATIRNGVADRAIQVEAATVTMTGDWQHTDMSAAASGSPDDHLLGLEMNGQDLKSATFPWKIEAAGSLDLGMKAVIPQQTNISSESEIATIQFTLNWSDNNPSTGLILTEEEATAMGFTFSPYEDGLQIDGFDNKQSKTEVNVPEQIGDLKVLKIKNNAFFLEADIQKITLPNTVKEIDTWAFCNCTGLISIIIPDSVIFIGGSAFAGCSSLTSIIIPDGITSIDSGLFQQCKNLVSVSLSDSVAKIESNAFNNCTSLKTVIIPDRVTSIGEHAFSGCTSLTVTIPNGVKAIDSIAFYNVPHIEYHGSASGAPWGAKSMN